MFKKSNIWMYVSIVLAVILIIAAITAKRQTNSDGSYSLSWFGSTTSGVKRQSV